MQDGAIPWPLSPGRRLGSRRTRMKPRKMTTPAKGAHLERRVKIPFGRMVSLRAARGELMEPRRSLRWLLLAAAMFGCGGQGPGTEPPPPPDALEVPRGLTVAQLESYGVFGVSWTLTTPQDVEVQARIASGNWQTVSFPSFPTGALVGLDSSQPERTPVSFRVRT